MKTGAQSDVNYMILLDSGFRRNDDKSHFLTFYETINFRHSKLVTSNLKKDNIELTWPLYPEIISHLG